MPRLTDTHPGDVGGQKTLRTYWKNYFEKTDTLIWVVDATDRERLDDCRQELMGLLLQEVGSLLPPSIASTKLISTSASWVRPFLCSRTRATSQAV